jgi:hypothetical protein
MPFTRAPNCATAPRLCHVHRHGIEKPTAERTPQSSTVSFCQSRNGAADAIPRARASANVTMRQSPWTCREHRGDYASVKKAKGGYRWTAPDIRPIRIRPIGPSPIENVRERITLRALGAVRSRKRIVQPSLDKPRSESYDGSRSALTNEVRAFFSIAAGVKEQSQTNHGQSCHHR